MTEYRRPAGEFTLIVENASSLGLDTLRQTLIVVVEEGDKFPSGIGQDSVPCGRNPLILVVTNEPYLGVLVPQPGQDLQRGVLGTIIHDQDFDRTPRLR